MPAYGLIPDSPLFYYAGKSLRSKRVRSGTNSIASNVRLGIKFSGLVLYKPIINYEMNAKTGMVGRYMVGLGTKIIAGAKERVGVKTGKLRDSIHMAHYATGRTQYIRVGSALKYALLHHEGSPPHLITPKPPRTHLRFASRKGAIVYATTVMHPGTKPNKYLSSQLRRYIR